MESRSLFKGVFPVLEKALDLRSMKHSLIVSNIANKDTPNYKAFDLIVEEELEKSMGKGDPTDLKTTHDGHLCGKRSDRINGKSVNDADQFFHRRDNNSVDIDKEMAKLSENNLLYNALAQILSRKFGGLKDVIKGGQ